MKSDALTYSRSKGLIAGVSLEGASIDTDNDANKKLYGKEIGAREIVTGKETVGPSAKPLVSLLDHLESKPHASAKHATMQSLQGHSASEIAREIYLHAIPEEQLRAVENVERPKFGPLAQKHDEVLN